MGHPESSRTVFLQAITEMLGVYRKQHSHEPAPTSEALSVSFPCN